MDTKKIIAGAITGFLTAALVDIHAWQSAPVSGPFDWGKAVTRWLIGAVTGAAAGAGLSLAS